MADELRWIEEFWAWFRRAAPSLAADFEDPRALAQLDERVSRLGPVTWELGPGASADCGLTISPDGELALLPYTETIISAAPSIDGWEFFAGRQPRDPALQFSLGDMRSSLEVDASAWRYALLRHPDGEVELILEQSNLVHASDEDRYLAAILLLDGLIGEATRLREVSRVESVVALPPEIADRASPVEVLAKHLRQLLSNDASR